MGPSLATRCSSTALAPAPGLSWEPLKPTGLRTLQWLIQVQFSDAKLGRIQREIVNHSKWVSDPEVQKCGKTCSEERDNQWLGACAHRWKNVFYISEHKLPNGVCYVIPSNFRTLLSQRICPCYKGYAVGAGHFLSPNSTEIIGGAPQQEQTGKLGSYFGSTVCAVDLNGDGLSDLLVGAPMYSKVREEGRVYVYINSGTGAKMTELETALAGSDLYAARFGESIANLGDIDNDGFEDVAVGAFLSDSAVLLRTRAVVIVEASLKHPDSVNRTKLDCVLNGQPAVCVNLMLCFNYSGRTVPGYIGRVVLLYNLSLDGGRRPDTAARFYFASNGTSEMTSGSIKIYNSNNVTCTTQQAFMRKDVRDILAPIHVKATYRLGDHILKGKSTDELPSLQPVLQQRKEDDIINSKFVFARFCSQENCSANLQVSGKFAFPKYNKPKLKSVFISYRPHEKKSYLAVGNMKTLMLNVTLYNSGDDAYQTALYIQLPKGLYFTKILDQEETQIHCEVSEKESHGVRLDCSVGYLYVDHLSKMDFTFVLDASSLSRAGDDLSISINATCENELNRDLLLDNSLILVLPQKHEVELNAHGSVTPTSFVYGPIDENSPVTCMKETINFTFHVSNPGLSLAPAVDLMIQIPNSFVPRDSVLFNVLDVKTTDGQCIYKNYTRDCTLPGKNESMLQDFITFLTKLDKRLLYCMKDDPFCLQILCNFGDMESGKEATVHVNLEATPSLLHMDEASTLIFEIKGKVSADQNPKVIELYKGKQTAYVGFFKRKYKLLPQEQNGRESWSFVNSNQNDTIDD
ncbi:hypothetical protein JD844_022967 [Phrynosoma platyrhinos]|uniref:Integrin alpha-4 n=1 Tax=Phrynosoma platyrhinos TaxID=52577 RepID=A0ABQ7SW55_PHRPL|nr:hypothetical protein JD844_022967 [Phrynosoma platyrhinos]